MQSYLGFERINGQVNVKNGQFIYDLSERENASKINELKGSLLYKALNRLCAVLTKNHLVRFLKNCWLFVTYSRGPSLWRCYLSVEQLGDIYKVFS